MTLIRVLFLALGFFLLDQISKNYFLNSGFEVSRNYGVVFGLFPNNLVARAVYLILTILPVVWVWQESRKRLSLAKALGAALVFGGVAGNWFDYFSRGYVADFISLRRFLPFWPEAWASYFNLADVWILAGIAVFALGTRTVERSDSGHACRQAGSRVL